MDLSKLLPVSLVTDRLVGLVVKASISRTEDRGFQYCLQYGDFSGLSHISDLKIDTPVATWPGAWCYRVSTGTGWPGISILLLGEIESLILSFHQVFAAHRLV